MGVGRREGVRGHHFSQEPTISEIKAHIKLGSMLGDLSLAFLLFSGP